MLKIGPKNFRSSFWPSEPQSMPKRKYPRPRPSLYGQELRLPGDVFSPNPPHDANENSKRIARATTALQNISHHDSKRHSYFPSSLKTCTHAFIRDDRVKPAFIPPYQGPFKILDRSDKFFTLNLRSESKAVSVDLLKPCLTFSDIHPQNPLGNKKRVVAQKGTSVFDTTSKTEIEAPRAAPIVSREQRQLLVAQVELANLRSVSELIQSTLYRNFLSLFF